MPEILSGAICSSSTMRRTAGERAVAGGVDPGVPRSAPAATDFFSDGAAFFSVGADLVSSIVATTSPIFTSWPSGTFVSSTPAFSATISVETLSVSSVNRGSPSFTKSPVFLCHAETRPLVIDSPTAGIFTSMLIDLAN